MNSSGLFSRRLLVKRNIVMPMSIINSSNACWFGRNVRYIACATVPAIIKSLESLNQYGCRLITARLKRTMLNAQKITTMY
jgi:hypothetical protein